MFGLAATAAVIATAAGLAHNGEVGGLEGSRYTAVESVLHQNVPDGVWTFTVDTVTGTVRGVAYIVRSGGCPGTTVLEKRWKRQVDSPFSVTLGGHDTEPAVTYCSQVIYTGSGSIQVLVTHPASLP